MRPQKLKAKIPAQNQAKRLKFSFLEFLRPIFILFSIILITTSSLKAQQEEVIDVVALKNGSLLKGEVIDIVPDSILRMKLPGGSFIVVDWIDIEKISKEIVEPESVEEPEITDQYDHKRQRQLLESHFEKDYKYPQRGYQNHTEVGFYLAQGLNSWITLTLHNINSYRVNGLFIPGIGIGLDRYMFEGTLLPIYLDIRGDLMHEKPVVPYYFGQAGYAVSFMNHSQAELEFKGGLMFSGGIGVRFNSQHKYSFTTALSYKLQQSTKRYQERDPWTGQPFGSFVTIYQTYSRMGLLVGISF